MPIASIEDKVRQIIDAKGKDGWIEAAECARMYSKDEIKQVTDIEEKRTFYRWFKKVMKGHVEGFQVFKLQGYNLMLGLESADLKRADALKRKWELWLPTREYEITGRKRAAF